MTLFQNTQRISSAEVARVTPLGKIVWRIRLEAGEVYLTDPDAEIRGKATDYIGEMAVIRLKHNRITHLSRP